MRKSILIAAALAAMVSATLLMRRMLSAPPLPKPEPYDGPIPTATSPRQMRVYGLITGVNYRVAAYGYAGGSVFERRDFSMAAALVRHPKGDLLVDTGFGRNIDAQFVRMPLVLRAITRYSCWQPAVDQLSEAGYDFKSLRAILLTHSHWDHVSGLPDFPDVPVWVTRAEREFIDEGGAYSFCRLFDAVNYHVYAFDSGAYLGFPSSYDVYHDGSIVVVPAPGHTPGGVIVFVTLHDGTRYAFVGDVVWQLEGLALGRERPRIIRKRADSDADGNRQQMLRLMALKARMPELIIVPAHDIRAFEQLPPLPKARPTLVDEVPWVPANSG